jgi:hypothetical protein
MRSHWLCSHSGDKWDSPVTGPCSWADNSQGCIMTFGVILPSWAPCSIKKIKTDIVSYDFTDTQTNIIQARLDSPFF